MTNKNNQFQAKSCSHIHVELTLRKVCHSHGTLNVFNIFLKSLNGVFAILDICYTADVQDNETNLPEIHIYYPYVFSLTIIFIHVIGEEAHYCVLQSNEQFHLTMAVLHA